MAAVCCGVTFFFPFREHLAHVMSEILSTHHRSTTEENKRLLDDRQQQQKIAEPIQAQSETATYNE